MTADDDAAFAPPGSPERARIPGAGRPELFEGVSEEPGSAKVDPVLVVDDMTRRFGGLTAVAVDHLEVQRGAITALIGPNGAGKTTFFNLLTRFDTPTSGTTRFDGAA